MAQNIATKKLNFMSRLVLAKGDFLATLATLESIKEEWDANAYADGASPAGNNITDSDLQDPPASGGSPPFPYLSATQVNQLIGAYEAIKTTIAANRGYLEAARP